MTNDLPILYSFRRCPYAIRARTALNLCGISTELREVVLKDKPIELLHASAKATVPVIVLPNGEVIDESLDVIDWAIAHTQRNIKELTKPLKNKKLSSHKLIQQNDGQFKYHLDRYKYADRYRDESPDKSETDYREKACEFIKTLEEKLANLDFLYGEPSFIDIAIFPFVRQFAHVDINWWKSSEFENTQRWLNYWLENETFTSIMKKYPQWKNGDTPTYLP